ncbi:hypothetical protein FJY93_01910 [Candidatus Kaiserbacteria bacterium]|nr:hypothetical protein [Candidatus Kaiserbacteria bacterium]
MPTDVEKVLQVIQGKTIEVCRKTGVIVGLEEKEGSYPVILTRGDLARVSFFRFPDGEMVVCAQDQETARDAPSTYNIVDLENGLKGGKVNGVVPIAQAIAMAIA